MDVERFRKVCALLSSSHEGERSAAALKATEMLQAGGRHWGEVSLGVVAPSGGQMEMIRLAMEVQRLHDLLEDAHGRNRRLDDKLRNLKREMSKLQERAVGSVRQDPDGALVDTETGEVVGQRGKKKRSKAEKEAKKEHYRQQWYEQQREANPRTVEPGDAQMRQAMKEALEGELPYRTQVFFTSVLSQESWTANQRGAIERTLRWAYNL